MDNKILLFISKATSSPIIAIFILVFSISVLFLFFTNQSEKNGLPAGRQGVACFKEYCFDVKLAQSGVEITKGLMFQKSLEQNKGMLFLFDKEAKYSFWMKNTLIPLDIIWINKNNKIVSISENNQPCKWYYCSSIKPTADAKYVLEVNSGIVQKVGLKIGDEIVLDIK